MEAGDCAMAKKKVERDELPLRLEYIDPADLAANPLNYRTHPAAQTQALKDVIGEVGWAGALLYNERTNRLIDGHARKELFGGAGPVPVLIGSWDEAQEAKILATLDPIAAMAEADKGKLDALLRQVQTESESVATMLQELAKDSGLAYGNPEPGAGGDEFDTTPEAGPTRTSPGELWVIGGKHRLLVGDCTVPENVERLMGGEKAALCLTDPPYGIEESYESYSDTAANLKAIIGAFLPIARSVADVVLLTSGNRHHRQYPDPDWTLAWVCPAGTGCGPWGFCCWQPVLAYGKDPYLSRGMGSRPDCYSKSESADNSLEHPCPKPIGVWMWFMSRGSADANDIVYDPFLGSGTTLIAAHRLTRRCFGMEIEPRYADVCLRRAEAEGLSVERS